MDPVAEVPSEERPLLGEQRGHGQDHGSIERQADGQEHGESNDTPLAEEHSTKKLAVIMTSMWLGVFMNALGIFVSV